MKKILILIAFLLYVNSYADKEESALNMFFVQGRFNPESHATFVKVEKKYSLNKDLYLNKEAYISFLSMAKQAERDGINLKILSATRTFNKQKYIWEKKWRRNASSPPLKRARKILQFSSMPSTSRHHWGTDIDINSVNSKYFSTKKGNKEYLWLKENAKKYGFCQPYTPKGEIRANGYNEEKWHWSYTPIAKKYTSYIEKHMKNDMIQGFLGNKTAKSINIVKNYMLGVNKDCL